ncbi:type I secretion membrane fusion protein, HlyD family [Burkholderiales bacterium JOSHI_001]|nr:type I secretion membrane fusion protein, HlyD family [Burkholderiales bacterium JOSHI_001]
MSQSIAATSHPVIELVRRYIAALSVAWGARAELAGPKRSADELAFLPAAVSLQASPVHPAPRVVAWLLMALFTIALAWSWFGQVDMVAVAPGRVVVSARTKVVQPLETSVVRAIHVADGAKVQAGQLLVELDPSTATADSANVQEQLRAAQSEARRAELLLQSLAAGNLAASTELDGDAVARALLVAEWQDIAAKLARMAAEGARRQAELDTAKQQQTKLSTMLPLAQQREADIRGLSEQGFVSGHAGQDRARERIEIERDLATQQARLAETQAALAEAQQSRMSYLAEQRRLLSDRLSQARLKKAQLEQESTKAQHRQGLTRLLAPVSGTVQQLAVHTSGGVVTPAQALMVLVPDDAEVMVEVAIDNKDIGFVRQGQVAEIKLETFPFTRYGTLPARVERVSADAVADEKRGAVYTASLVPLSGSINVDGKPVRLSPGMNLTAEVKTGRRSVIDFLLSPIQKTVEESGKER